MTNLPHDIDAEKAVIGGLLLDSESFETASDLLRDADFFDEKHRILFAAVREILREGRPVDLVTLSSYLKETDNLKRAGGMAYAAELVDFTPTSAAMPHYCGIVRNNALRRRIIDAARKISQAAQENTNPDAVRSMAYSALEDIDKERKDVTSSLLTLDNLADRYENHVKTLRETRFTTGFPEIDAIIKGVAPGETMFITAYSGLFKSALLQNILLRACGRTKLHHLFFSLEMPGERVFERTVQISLEEYTYRIESGFDHHIGYKDQTLEELRKLGADRLIVCEEPCLTIERIEQLTRLARGKFGQLGAIGIDYLGLMGAEGAKSEYERISYVAENMKHLAKRLKIPVVVLTQVNRQSAGVQVETWSAKGSGAIEASADYMIGLQRDQNKNLIMKILKNRNGEASLDFQVNVEKAYLKFREVEPYNAVAAKNVERGKSRIKKSYLQEPPGYDPY